jgi:predicted nucleotidyltransferase component of viral defense system
VQFPWHRDPHCRIKLEITHEEPVMMTPDSRPLIHGYDEELAVQVRCYQLEEIAAEKLRTLLQTHQKLVARAWNRPRARDYYDLWRILGAYGDALKNAQLIELLHRKCEHRKVSFAGVDDFFTKELLAESHRHWDTNLRPFVADLPTSDTVLTELRPLVDELFAHPCPQQ